MGSVQLVWCFWPVRERCRDGLCLKGRRRSLRLIQKAPTENRGALLARLHEPGKSSELINLPANRGGRGSSGGLVWRLTTNHTPSAAVSLALMLACFWAAARCCRQGTGVEQTKGQ